MRGLILLAIGWLLGIAFFFGCGLVDVNPSIEIKTKVGYPLEVFGCTCAALPGPPEAFAICPVTP